MICRKHFTNISVSQDVIVLILVQFVLRQSLEWFTTLAKSLRKFTDVLILSKCHGRKFKQDKRTHWENVVF